MDSVYVTSLEEHHLKEDQSEIVPKKIQTDIENGRTQMVSGIDHPSSQYDSASIIDSDPCHIVDIDIRKPHSFISGTICIIDLTIIITNFCMQVKKYT